MSFVTDFFNDEFPLALQKHAVETRGNGLKYKIVVHDEGKWMIDCSVNPATVYQTEEWGDAQVELNAQDTEDIIKNPNLSVPYYLQKRIVVKGQTTIFSKFWQILQLR